MNKLYTAQEVADQLKIKKTTVYELIKRGELQSSKIGKQLRISNEQLEAYIAGVSSAAASLPAQPVYTPESSILKRDYLKHSNGLIISGPNSPGLDILCSQLESHPDGMPVLHSHMNGYNGLYSLYFGKVHAALSDLPNDINRSLVPNTALVSVHLYHVPLGLYLKKGNPKNIQTLADLSRSDLIFCNRERGCGSRILLDGLLKKANIHADIIQSYQKEQVSAAAAANAVALGKADAAIGDLQTAAMFPQIESLPLCNLSTCLIFPHDQIHRPVIQALIQILQSEEFKKSIESFPAYDTSQTGMVQYL